MRRAPALAPALLLLAACSSTPTAPAYTVTNRTEQTPIGYAELLLPGANTNQARDAITDYTAGINPQRHELYFVKVVQAADTERYVCRARWYRDADAYQEHSNGQASPTSWPHLAVNCPQ